MEAATPPTGRSTAWTLASARLPRSLLSIQARSELGRHSRSRLLERHRREVRNRSWHVRRQLRRFYDHNRRGWSNDRGHHSVGAGRQPYYSAEVQNHSYHFELQSQERSCGNASHDHGHEPQANHQRNHRQSEGHVHGELRHAGDGDGGRWRSDRQSHTENSGRHGHWAWEFHRAVALSASRRSRPAGSEPVNVDATPLEYWWPGESDFTTAGEYRADPMRDCPTGIGLCWPDSSVRMASATPLRFRPSPPTGEARSRDIPT